MTLMRRFCFSCKHFRFSPYSPGYGEDVCSYGGDPAAIECLLNKWDFQKIKDAAGLVQALEMAQVCPKYQEAAGNKEERRVGPSVPAEYRSQVPVGKSGNWAVERFVVSEEAARFEQLRATCNPQRPNRATTPGTYTRLVRGREVIMSDTPAEIADLKPILERVKYLQGGRVLVTGLGLGCAVDLILGLGLAHVRQVTVVEISPDVVALVGPHLKNKWNGRLEIVTADAFTWRAPRGVYFHAAWHDIWDAICSDNLEEMARLHRHYNYKVTGKQMDWCHEECLLAKRQGNEPTTRRPCTPTP